jgi:hypothetical protein
VVRRDHVVPVGERRNQIAEHVGAGRKPVQQNQRGRIRVARFTVEHPMTVDGGVSMMNSRHDIPPEPTKRAASKFWVV